MQHYCRWLNPASVPFHAVHELSLRRRERALRSCRALWLYWRHFTVVLNLCMANQQRKRSPSLGWFLTAAVLVGAVVAAALFWNRHRPLKTVELDGWQHVAAAYRDSVATALTAGLASGSIVHLRDAEAIAERFPFVYRASARRIGSVLHVSVVEREPLALVVSNQGQLQWLTADSALLPSGAYYGGAILPIVWVRDSAGIAPAVRVLRLLALQERLGACCAELHVDASKNITLRLEPPGVTVLLGQPTALETKLAYADWLIGSPWWRPNVRRVDLRWSRRIVLQTEGTTAGRVDV
ncbi:MAG: hypothetical protein KatS3mg040_0908 [Candidatus Kapaibacterium sp.]|nr:MAG: hypothetical protein KatS3mg040_0908 [Candidatus Kapabacteria bacterium]